MLDRGAVRGGIQTELPSVWWIDACIDIAGADDTREQIMDYTVVQWATGVKRRWFGLHGCNGDGV